MRRWLTAAAFYLLAAVIALVLSVGVSLFSTMALNGFSNDDNPAAGLMWLFLLVVEGSLIVSFSLGVTAELLERRAQLRSFRWLSLLWRIPCALGMLAGPVYDLLWVRIYREDARPHAWVWKVIGFYCVSIVFAFLALRIRRQPLHTEPSAL